MVSISFGGAPKVTIEAANGMLPDGSKKRLEEMSVG
jgi:hypothetical protein